MMRGSSDERNRRSIRLTGYDYSQAGAYFVTVCVNSRRSLFGDIEDGKMALSDVGWMVYKWWKELEQKYSRVLLDEYCIMPNHMHGIIQIVGADLCVRPNMIDDGQIHKGQTRRSAPTVSLADAIQWFKTMSTNEYIRNIKSNSWPSFNKYFWQRNYYEHVIRDDNDLSRIREYIVNNPVKWEEDEYYVQ